MGASSAGEYARTLQLADVASGWSARMVLLNRGQAAMEGGFRSALARLPFALVDLHPANRSYCAEYKAKVALEALKGLRHRLPPTLRRLVDGKE